MNAQKASQGMCTNVGDPEDDSSHVKIAMLDMNFQEHRMAMGVSIQIKDPKEIENIQRQEIDITKEKIQ